MMWDSKRNRAAFIATIGSMIAMFGACRIWGLDGMILTMGAGIFIDYSLMFYTWRDEK